MIEVTCEDGIFKAKGSFSLGIAGVFTNEDFDSDIICFDEDLLENINERDEFWVKPLLPFIKSDDPNEIAKNVAEYYNQKEREIAANADQINGNILYRLFDNMEACGYPFWEIKEAVLPGYLEKYSEDEYDSVVYCHRDNELGSRLFEFFDDKPNNGTLEKPNVEKLVRKLYPMFNLDGFVKSFEPECLYLNGKYISFQFSDGWGKDLACAAYDEMDENFTFHDWHNH